MNPIDRLVRRMANQMIKTALAQELRVERLERRVKFLTTVPGTPEHDAAVDALAALERERDGQA